MSELYCCVMEDITAYMVNVAKIALGNHMKVELIITKPLKTMDHFCWRIFVSDKLFKKNLVDICLFCGPLIPCFGLLVMSPVRLNLDCAS